MNRDILKKIFLLFTLLPLTSCSEVAKQEYQNNDTLNYHLNLENSSIGEIIVTLSLKNETASLVEVAMPDPEGCAARLVGDLQVNKGSVQQIDGANPDRIFVKPTISGEFEASVKVSSKSNSRRFNPQGIDSCFPVITDDSIAYFEGKSVIPFLKVFGFEPESRILFNEASISWSLPSGWTKHSSLQDLTSVRGSNVVNLIWDSQFMAGDLDVYEKEINNNVIVVTKPKDYEFNGVDVLDLLEGSFLAYSNAYGELGDSKYSTFLLPVTTEDEQYNIVASATQHSNVIFIWNGDGFKEIGLVAAHELAHRWIPSEISENWDQDLAWLSEGVVDYASYLELLRLGHISSEEFIQRVNQAIVNLAHAEHVLPYDIGFLAGLSLDNLKTDKSVNDGTLSSFIRKLIADKKRAQNKDGVIKILNEILDIHPKLKNEPPLDFTLPVSLGLPCNFDTTEQSYKLSLARYPNYHIGFDILASSSEKYIGIIDNVTNAGNAYEVGIRDGYKIIEKLSGGSGDIHRPLSFSVEANNGETESVSYFPHGELSDTRYLQYIQSDVPRTQYANTGLMDTKCAISKN